MAQISTLITVNNSELMQLCLYEKRNTTQAEYFSASDGIKAVLKLPPESDHTYEQHLHGQQVDENEALVSLAGAMAVLEGECQVLFRCQDTNMLLIKIRHPYAK